MPKKKSYKRRGSGGIISRFFAVPKATRRTKAAKGHKKRHRIHHPKKYGAKKWTREQNFFGRTTYVKRHGGKQRLTGHTTPKRDKLRRALSPGKRKTLIGKVYYEYRANRSDHSRRRRI